MWAHFDGVPVGVEEFAGRELGGRVQLAGRVHRGEHEVGLARVLVELRSAVAGEPFPDDPLHRVDVLVRRGEDVPRRPVALGQHWVVDQPGDGLE